MPPDQAEIRPLMGSRGVISAERAQADPRGSLEVGQERVDVHVRQFVRLGIWTTGVVHTVALSIGGWRSGCRAAPQATVTQDLLDHVHLRRFDERDHLHLAAAFRTR